MQAHQATFNTSKTILASVGIPILGECVKSKDLLRETCDRLGYPVVMKVIAEQIVHKTDVGVVRLGIASYEEAERVYDELLENARKAGAQGVAGVLVQKQARAGFELLIGARQDPVFGPVTMVGYGGRYVELFKDVAPGVGNLSAEDVERMLSETLAGRVIEGFRGPPLDKQAVIDLTLRVSRLMAQRPDVRELDLNPVILYEKGFAVVDARVVLGEAVQHPRAEDLSAKRLASLQAVFDAKSVAVVGASSPGTIGGIILKNSSRLEKLYPINPKHETLMGLKCYPDFKSLPEPADVAVFVVPPEPTIRGFEEFCERGGKAAIIVSDGYAEIGRPDLEERLQQIAEKHDVVYIGPNGLGVFDNFSGFNTLFLPRLRSDLPTKPGPIGVISQSGGIGLELLEMAAADNLPIGKWVSCGNASGVSIPELLKNMGDDPRIKIVALYMEGLRNGLQFVEVAREVAKTKPVLVIKGGMAGGAAATMSHTASLAGSFQAFRAACQDAGLYLLQELTEDPKVLINILSILTTQKPAAGGRVGVVSVGGGAAILLADQITSEGMELSVFSEGTREKLSKLFEAKIRAASAGEQQRIADRVCSNPLDLFGDANDERLLESIRILNEDPNTDVIMLATYFQVPYLSEYVSERLIELKREMTKPLIISPRGHSQFVMRTREFMSKHGLHSYTVPTIKPLSIAVDIWKRYQMDFSA